MSAQTLAAQQRVGLWSCHACLHNCSYGMRGVLDIRVEASSGSAASGYHSGLHGGVVEEPMQASTFFIFRAASNAVNVLRPVRQYTH